MATQYKPAEIIRSVKTILQEGRESRKDELSIALQMMQLASAQKVQKMQMAEAQLKRLEVTNLQVSHAQAGDWLSLTGFNRWYNPEKDDWANTMVDFLTDDPDMEDGVNTGGFGFNDHDAWRIASAVQSFHLKEPGSILEIANELSFKADSGVQDSFVKGFYNTGIFSESKREITYQHLANISKTIQNRDMIAQESYEYGTGDFDITRDIQMAGRVQLPTGDEADDAGQWAAVSAASQGVFSGEIQTILSTIEEEEVEKLRLDQKMNALNVAIAEAQARARADLELTPRQQSLLQDADDARQSIEDEMTELNISIGENRVDAQKLTMQQREEAIRSGEIAMKPPVLHFGIDYLQKMWYKNQTGIWPSDELLREAEDVAQAKRDKSWQDIWDHAEKEQALFNRQVGREG